MTKTKKQFAATDLKKRHGGSSIDGTIMNCSLLGQIIGTLDINGHALHGEESGQVCSVGGDDDESEEPPHGAHYACGGGPRHDFTTCVNKV